jgi:hypothetical protein
MPVSRHLVHAISERKEVVDASTHFLTESSTCWRDASAILNSGAGDDVLQWLARESEINNRRGAKGVRIAKARSSRASHFGLRVKGNGTTHSLYMPFCALILAGSSRRSESLHPNIEHGQIRHLILRAVCVEVHKQTIPGRPLDVLRYIQRHGLRQRKCCI